MKDTWIRGRDPVRLSGVLGRIMRELEMARKKNGQVPVEEPTTKEWPAVNPPSAPTPKEPEPTKEVPVYNPPSEPGENGDSHRPIHEVRLGRIVGAVWQNTGEDGFSRYQTCITRIYKNEETGAWDRSGYFGGAYDLLAVAEVARQCANFVFEAQQTKTPF